MSQKATKESHSQPIDAIRSIIFGEQEKFFNEKLNRIEKKIEDMNANLLSKIDEVKIGLENEQKNLVDKIYQMQNLLNDKESGISDRIAGLNEELKQWIQDLEAKKLDRESLANQFQALSDFIKTNQ